MPLTQVPAPAYVFPHPRANLAQSPPGAVKFLRTFAIRRTRTWIFSTLRLAGHERPSGFRGRALQIHRRNTRARRSRTTSAIRFRRSGKPVFSRVSVGMCPMIRTHRELIRLELDARGRGRCPQDRRAGAVLSSSGNAGRFAPAMLPLEPVPQEALDAAFLPSEDRSRTAGPG